MKHEGYRGFYKGWCNNLGKSVFSSALFFVSYE